VLFPSGTMANTAALLTWAGPGDAVLAEPLLHAVKAEKAAFSDRLGRLKAVTYRVTPQGKPDLDSARELLAQNTIKVLLLENTHNFRGGVCLDAGETDALCAAAHDRGVPVHLDGARIFNAAARTGEYAARLCRGADSVMFCLSKGLGAPAGSLVAGDKAFIGALRETRKLLGGTMRQAGVIAAPGLYALRSNIENAARDNANAALFAREAGEMARLRLCHEVQSNIVMLDTSGTGLTAEAFCDRAYAAGLWIRPVLQDRVRLVFWSGINAAQARRAAEIMAALDRELA
ncbi:MAG TPA: beta-eliminating lyase-related protein, partial [Candidatus Limnocylindria bacterium]|nr:beta-eliminating lyase-related protein [Candidatus Limnocylindria bacterium]